MKWVVTLNPRDYSLMGVGPEQESNINPDTTTLSGVVTVIVEAETEDEAVAKAPTQAMHEEIARLKEAASSRWKRDQEENDRRAKDTEESIRVIKKFYEIIRSGRLELFGDGKSIHIEWYSPEGLRKCEVHGSSGGLLKNITDTISEAPLADEDCW